MRDFPTSTAPPCPPPDSIQQPQPNRCTIPTIHPCVAHIHCMSIVLWNYFYVGLLCAALIWELEIWRVFPIRVPSESHQHSIPHQSLPATPPHPQSIHNPKGKTSHLITLHVVQITTTGTVFAHDSRQRVARWTRESNARLNNVYTGFLDSTNKLSILLNIADVFHPLPQSKFSTLSLQVLSSTHTLSQTHSLTLPSRLSDHLLNNTLHPQVCATCRPHRLVLHLHVSFKPSRKK